MVIRAAKSEGREEKQLLARNPCRKGELPRDLQAAQLGWKEVRSCIGCKNE
jgi:hypothetical protein